MMISAKKMNPDTAGRPVLIKVNHRYFSEEWDIYPKNYVSV